MANSARTSSLKPSGGIIAIRKRVDALRNLPQFLALAWRTSRTLVLLSLCTRVTRALVPIATLFIAAAIIDEVVYLTRLSGTPVDITEWWSSGLLDRLARLLLVSFGVALLSDILNRLAGLVDTMLGERFTNTTSAQLISHAARLDLAGLEESETQNKLERARRQTSGGTSLIGEVSGQVQDLITVASLAVGVIAYAPGLVVLLVLALVPALLGELHFTGKIYTLAHERTEQLRELDYLRRTGASVETAKEVKLFGLSGFLAERYLARATDLYRARRNLAAKHACWGLMLAGIGSAGSVLAYAFMAWETIAGQFTIGEFTFLSGSFAQLRGSLSVVLLRTSSLAAQAIYLDDFFSFFTIRPRIASPHAPRPFPRVLQYGIRFENVGFRYPGGDHWAVRGLTFEIRAGEVVALVGENGAGKTTIVKLLTRLYDPDEGRILIDGFDLRDFDLDEVRANMGVIFQDFIRYHFTAADNIAVGRIDARHDRPRIESAAERSLADEVIRALPWGYDQMIGKRFQRGVDLSVGEWQRIAIGRAYMREAQILILDEPTASLDARAEQGVFQRFKELSAGKTGVLISHRFSSVRMADRIVVLRRGSIDSIGTHDELLGIGGGYAELFELQAAGYR